MPVPPDLQASEKLSQAAGTMADTPGALQLRLLETIVSVAAEKNSTLVLPFPVELLRFLERSTPTAPPAAPTAPQAAPTAPQAAPTAPQAAPTAPQAAPTAPPAAPPIPPPPPPAAPPIPGQAPPADRERGGPIGHGRDLVIN